MTPRLLRMLREAALYVFGAIAVYLFISLWTYTPSDPSWSHSGPPGAITNAGGRSGAWVADVFLNLFGFIAYLFPFMVGFIGWRIFEHRKDAAPPDRRQSLIVGVGFLMTVLGACGLVSLHYYNGVSATISAGGVLGDLVGRAFVAAFSDIGATLFLLTIFLAGMTLFTGLSWLRLMDTAGRLGFTAFQRSRDYLSVAIDYVVGLRARRLRRENVEDEKKVLSTHPAPRIEPVFEPVKPSARVEREKQVPLFAVSGSKELPPLSLLDPSEEKSAPQFTKQSLESMSRLVEKKLLDFNIEVRVVAVHPGPVITRFEIEPAPGVKAAQITNLAKDLARSLSVISLRVVENIPGKSFVGLEIPNEVRESVRLSQLLSSQAYENDQSALVLALGKDIGGTPVVVDLAKMPHLMIAGTTGSGKSVCVNALIMSLVYKWTPEHVRLIMVDPKMLELAVYDGIPHLLSPVVTDMKQAANALKWCIAEMERRYRLMAALGVRNVIGYNRKLRDADKSGQPILDPLVQEGEQAEPLSALPYIVIIIDELADLMMVVGKKVEELIARLAQKARAAGLHLILATQRPSVDVITGLIKANIPSRIAFQMSSRVDSRTVLDQMGAEQLLGQGDMLFLQPGHGLPMRVHGAFVSDQEVHKVAKALKQSGDPVYDDKILSGESVLSDANIVIFPGFGNGSGNGEADPLYDEALMLVTQSRRASISGVQRRLRIGYNRAARLIEEMEKAGVVGPLQSNGNREVLAPAPPAD